MSIINIDIYRYLVGFDLRGVFANGLHSFRGAHRSPLFIAVLVDCDQLLQW